MENSNIKVGQKYYSKVMKEVFEVVEIHEDRGSIYFKGAEKIGFVRREDGAFVLNLKIFLVDLKEGEYTLCE